MFEVIRLPKNLKEISEASQNARFWLKTR